MTLDNEFPACEIGEPAKRSSMYSTDDLALIFNCSSRHIRRLVFRGDFPRPVKVGNLSRWLQDDVTRWLTEASCECNKAQQTSIDYPKGVVNTLSGEGKRDGSE